MIREIIGAVLMLGGMFFLIVAAIGVFRLPDPFLRLHASTKAGTLGAGLLVAGVAVSYTEENLGLTAFVIIVFLLATLPVAGHLLGRATYVSGADFVMKDGNDGLKGVLPRAEASLEARLAGRSADPALPTPEKQKEKAEKAKVKTGE
ncbi:monovalent cation/H(+) antiporter subunit G [Glycocaulis sp.]|uniref:monovalent cation/H(+) antiporter subunit G n=1 Tax=Glycocaulis sp. TaxID=1969725 RepID=UPI003F730190